MSVEKKDFKLDPFTFYSLDDLERIYELESNQIIKDATLDIPMIKLCIHVPKDFHVYSVDISSIDQGGLENINRQLKPGYVAPEKAESPQLICDGEVEALIVEKEVLRDITRNLRSAGQIYFLEAYFLVEEKVLGLSRRRLWLSTPKRIYPIDDVPQHFDLSRARFALYPFGAQLTFTESEGYPAPSKLRIHKKDLLVLGSELWRYIEKKTLQCSQENAENQHLNGDSLPLEPLVEKVQDVDGQIDNVDETAVDVSLEGKMKVGKKKSRDNFVKTYIRKAVIKLIGEGINPTPTLVMEYLRSIADQKNSGICLLYTSPSPRDGLLSRMPSSA